MKKAISNIIKHTSKAVYNILGQSLTIIFMPLIAIVLSLWALSWDNPLDFWEESTKETLWSPAVAWSLTVVAGIIVMMIESILYSVYWG